MRIEPDRSHPGEMVRDAKSPKEVSHAGVPFAAARNIEDRASLSGEALSVSALEAQALAQPEIRQRKVDSLRDAMEKCEYRIDSGSLAKAIVEHQKR